MRNKGFIGTIFLIIVGLALLKYFLNWDIFDAASSDQGQSTIDYVRSILDTIWTYIGYPITFAWNQVVWPILQLAWHNFQAFIEWGRATSAQGI